MFNYKQIYYDYELWYYYRDRYLIFTLCPKKMYAYLNIRFITYKQTLKFKFNIQKIFNYSIKS